MKKDDERDGPVDEDENERSIDNVNEVYSNNPDAPSAKAGSEEMGSLPNDPAKNAKLTSPEEDEENARREKGK